MKAISLKLHNFRTFADTEISLSGYSLLVGANNAGKSNLIDSIRIFYEKDIKFGEVRDFPKFATADKESWIELQFKPSTQEFALLKQEYQSADGIFRVRKYFQSSELDDDKKQKAGIYAYVGGQLSNSRFYGAKNIQQGKFGDLIYIPAVSRLDDHTKLTGPSALRDLINSVLKKIMDSSSAYGELRSAFNDNEFGGKLKNEVTGEGYSLSGIETAISQDIQDWGTSFELFVNPVIPDNLVKTLVGHRVHDKALGQTQDPKSYGQGFQRLLIFTLIKLSVPSRPSEVCANRLCLPLDGYFHNKFP
jgi:putative ATP-dependent endonuclease of OLD family